MEECVGVSTKVADYGTVDGESDCVCVVDFPD
jgi:hypothetical protein